MEENFNFDFPGIEPADNSQPESDVTAAPAKAKGFPKIIVAAVGAIAAIALIIVLISALFGNTYKTPVKTIEKILNTKKNFKVEDMALDLLNGYCKKDVKNILKIMKKTDAYKDGMEQVENSLEDLVENLEDEWGKNYKISLKIGDKDKIDKDDLKDFEEFINDGGDQLKDEIDDMDSDEIEEMADELEISKSNAKKLVKSAGNIAKKLKKAKVKAGYELEIKIKITGKELDDPIEEEVKINVYKVDGKWLPWPSDDLMNMAGSMMGGFL